MNDFLNQLAFGWYPYLAITVLIVGSILRFDADQYSWRSQSSQFLRRRQMIVGSNLFHMGVIVLFGGHFIGLLTPIWVFESLGVPHAAKQLLAMAVGGVAGMAAFIGCSLLLHRRLFDQRIRQTSSIGDISVLVLIWVQLVLGVLTIFWSAQHLSGEEMLALMGWANAIVTFDPTAPTRLTDTALIFKLHIILGLTLFLITPFTRLVHIWSAPIWFLFRPGYQIVRSLGPVKPSDPPRGPTIGGAARVRERVESGRPS